MKKLLTMCISVLTLLLVIPVSAQTSKYIIFVVSSYHHEYLWSQDTQKGICAGLIEYGFIDSNDQATEFT